MIGLDDIRNLAQLARLKLTTAEEESLQKDMSSILDYVGQVSAVPMPEKKEDAGVLHNVMRADTPRPAGDTLSDKEAALVAAFPASEKGYNVVRKIIQKDE
ncbi:MAG TPA: Asp-tRNA(Asn)/Glu-tRNA(Gln) amidotransferase subunit GatC [Candidatus Paceibacterota bacterium]|jgi:aspartyl/glutamyl-tRNA(Asn/Gln) amidotransferase C subunit|nr:Asp-tRNA(Asn)/Glu-tRNA(Gln) amidotransferase subunit GatC [Candidatus Paceibacterota bacterium]